MVDSEDSTTFSSVSRRALLASGATAQIFPVNPIVFPADSWNTRRAPVAVAGMAAPAFAGASCKSPKARPPPGQNAIDLSEAKRQGLPNTLARDVGRARAQLKTLFGDIKLTPAGDHLEAELSGSFEGLLTLTASNAARVKIQVVAGAGFEPATFRL